GGHDMKRLVVAVVASLVALGPSAFPASAQTGAGVLDHLMCYRMTDPLQVSQAVDMFSDVQPQFSQKGCVLIKPVQFCVPATKRNVTPALTTPNLIGQQLQNDFICYLVKCPNPVPPPDENVTDQFGTRTQTKYRPFTICAPARKAPVTCHQTIIT